MPSSDDDAHDSDTSHECADPDCVPHNPEVRGAKVTKLADYLPGQSQQHGCHAYRTRADPFEPAEILREREITFRAEVAAGRNPDKRPTLSIASSWRWRCILDNQISGVHQGRAPRAFDRGPHPAHALA